MKNQSDLELIKQSIEGNVVAYEALVERHCSMVFKVAYKWCGVQEDAEDISQDVFLKLAEKIRGFKPDQAAFTTWLYRVTINIAKDFYRKKNTRKDKEKAYAETKPVASTSQPQEEKMLKAEIINLLDRLPEKEKDAVLLICLEGFSHKDASIVLGCAETTVSWRVHKARKKLQKWVNQ